MKTRLAKILTTLFVLIAVALLVVAVGFYKVLNPSASGQEEVFFDSIEQIYRQPDKTDHIEPDGDAIIDTPCCEVPISDVILQIVLDALEKTKSENFKINEGANFYIVTATGKSNSHVSEIEQKITEGLQVDGLNYVMTGDAHADWVLIDAGEVVVHICAADVCEAFDLEKIRKSIADLRREQP